MSCLFDSIAHFMPVSSGEIRDAACTYLASQKPLMHGLSTGDICDDTYIKSMQSRSTWGSAIEIKAICCIYNVRIAVHSTRPGDDNATFVFKPFTQGPSLFKTFELDWNGSHYTPRSQTLPRRLSLEA